MEQSPSSQKTKLKKKNRYLMKDAQPLNSDAIAVVVLWVQAG
jgi:hypothetical protein